MCPIAPWPALRQGSVVDFRGIDDALATLMPAVAGNGLQGAGRVGHVDRVIAQPDAVEHHSNRLGIGQDSAIDGLPGASA